MANFEPINLQIVRDEAGDNLQEKFFHFLNEFTVAPGQSPFYADKVAELCEPERNMLSVDFSHIDEFDANMAEMIQMEFYRFHPYLTRAIALCAQQKNVQNTYKKDLYISIENFPNKKAVRELTADTVGQLVRISGQVVRTHPVHPELSRGVFLCHECGAAIKYVEQQFKYTTPSRCTNNNCSNRIGFALDIHDSVFVDFQKIRIQETQAELPRGSIPRSVEIIVRGECVELAQPGDRCDFTGCLIVVPDVSQIATPGVRADPKSNNKGVIKGDAASITGLKSLGVRELTYKMAFLAVTVSTQNPKLGGIQYTHEQMSAQDLNAALTEKEKVQILEMVEDSGVAKKMANSLFPDIYGHEEVKLGALLQLFGGVPKRTQEGTTLRGDINVCLVGDPSTAKSQVLKTIEQFCPRAVYTSGKASSAAGLTAAVVKDEEGYEFVIEAGALMLADNGVCCIDEFDKMDVKDQVAIHEAMEQQTISITKAGVKATLNARTSILAAANPIGGRYDKAKSLRHNIQMSAPIMSRFDLFFVLIDECNEATDHAIARRILNAHQRKDRLPKRFYSYDQMQRYIMFARCFQPVLTPAAGRSLVEEYKRLRMRDTHGGNGWRITVRQLESLIRLSEATARLHCTEQVTPEHVKSAAALLQNSIVRVEQAEVLLNDDDMAAIVPEELMETDDKQIENRENIEPEGAKEKMKTTLSFDEYERMATMLALRLRNLEELEDDSTDMNGVRQSELVNWYLNEVQDEIGSEQELFEKKELVIRVIRRMIHHDNILLSLGVDKQSDEHDDADPYLVVHPNFELE